MNKSAKEMFEEIGYELIENGKRYLRFANYEDKERHYYGGEFIDFEKINLQFRLTRKTCNGNTHFKYGSIKEFKAIQKQIEELGWNEK